jgi:hypothetical protein
VKYASLSTRLRADAASLVPGLPVVALFIIWAVHNGGYDSDTWYWGALAVLALLFVTVVAFGPSRLRLTRTGAVALGLFALYVCWSYLSILWAQSQGTALQGSNRALLYLLVFALLLVVPWTSESALLALLVYTIGIGVTAVVLLFHLAFAQDVGSLFVGGRLAAPTGYVNATAALFMIAALPSIVLASRRELPALLRGLLLAFATAELQLALTGQSRGWLFTLPLVLIAAIVVVPDRLRVTAAAILPTVGAAVVARRLLHVYQDVPSDPLTRLAHHAAPDALIACFGVLVVGTMVAWAGGLRKPRPLPPAIGAAIGITLAAAAIAACCVVGLIVSDGHPGRYISRQWHGFAHDQGHATSSHFTDVGSGRYDIWRVSLHAFEAHPIGGLGMDNFADYYIRRGRSGENPSWPHSLEMRLLAMTGIVGFVLFASFMVVAFVAVVVSRRRGLSVSRATAAAAALPAIVWLIHGSVDWFWEMPALSGPALGFLAIAGSLSAWRPTAEEGVDGAASASPPASHPRRLPTESRRGIPHRRRIARLGGCVGVLAFVAAAVVLVFPYLSVREVSIASNIQGRNPSAALRDLQTAAELNPLDADPERLAGVVALRAGKYRVARKRFEQSLRREPGDWFSWFGAGLAASARGARAVARHDYSVAESIYRQQPVIRVALQRVDGSHPLTPGGAFKLLKMTLEQ